MAKGCDSSWDFDYKSRVDALVDGGYTFIGRYLNHSAGVRNGLTVSEANRLSNAGVFMPNTGSCCGRSPMRSR